MSIVRPFRMVSSVSIRRQPQFDQNPRAHRFGLVGGSDLDVLALLGMDLVSLPLVLVDEA